MSKFRMMWLELFGIFESYVEYWTPEQVVATFDGGEGSPQEELELSVGKSIPEKSSVQIGFDSPPVLTYCHRRYARLARYYSTMEVELVSQSWRLVMTVRGAERGRL
jgi:hypothetical protein